MHALLGLATVLVALAAGEAALRRERHLSDPTQRRLLLLGVLLAPVVGLAIEAVAVNHQLEGDHRLAV